MPLLTTCLECGEPSDGPRCDEHRLKAPSKTSFTKRGYDSSWTKLSRRARRLQPWCSDCGTTEDLTGDHTPEAWARKAQGLPIRLQDIDVVCRADNSRRGAARGDSTTRGVGVDNSVFSPSAKAKFPTDTPLGYKRLGA